MQCPTFTNVYRDLNIKKIRAAKGGPLNRGAPCHGITGILVNLAMISVLLLIYKYILTTFLLFHNTMTI